jgi:zinc transport system substrate-binding protein
MRRLIFLLLGAFSVVFGERVLVTIPPEAFLVERIAGDTVEIETLVPPGANPHTFEPTAKGAISAVQADVWFRMGEPSENRVLKAIEAHNPELRVVDMRQGLPLLGHVCDHPGCTHDGSDPHYWLSPMLARRMAIRMASVLSRRFPEHRQLYTENLRALLRDLNALDRDLKQQLAPFRGDALLVSHAALAYFCRDYGLRQIALEVEGREPSPRQLVQIVEQAKEDRVRRVIVQEAFNPKGGELVAEQLDVPICRFDPLERDLIQNLRDLGNCIQ